jgi:hypothetical protein
MGEVRKPALITNNDASDQRVARRGGEKEMEEANVCLPPGQGLDGAAVSAVGDRVTSRKRGRQQRSEARAGTSTPFRMRPERRRYSTPIVISSFKDAPYDMEAYRCSFEFRWKSLILCCRRACMCQGDKVIVGQPAPPPTEDSQTLYMGAQSR